jgi:hypothetical protein
MTALDTVKPMITTPVENSDGAMLTTAAPSKTNCIGRGTDAGTLASWLRRWLVELVRSEPLAPTLCLSDIEARGRSDAKLVACRSAGRSNGRVGHDARRASRTLRRCVRMLPAPRTDRSYEGGRR